MKNKSSKPPMIARWLLSFFLNHSHPETILADFEEIYHEIARSNGTIVAKLWYWFQIVAAIPSFVNNLIYWSVIMFRNYLKIALRNINNHKEYSLINISGLALGMAAVIIILIYVQYELSFDRYHKNADRIFRIIREGEQYKRSKQSALTPPPLAPALKNEYPEILLAARFDKIDNVLLSYGEKVFYEDNFYFADPEAFDIFSLNLLAGNTESALVDPFSIILSKRMVDKYFADDEPLGKVINFKGKYDFKVTGILEDMPENSHFIMDFIVPFKTVELYTGWRLTGWGLNAFYTYILLNEQSEPEELEAKFPAFVDKHFYVKNTKLLTQPLTKIHLHSHMNFEMTANGNIKTIYLFASIAFLILITACINYMNLVTARSTQRSKEVGIRKVVGAQRGQLVKQFLGESLMLTGIAVIFAIILVKLFLPTFNTFVERELSFIVFDSSSFIIWLAAIILFVGISAGIYPALAISSFKLVSILRGKSGGGHKGTVLRNVLVVAQFSFSIILIISTLVVRKQLDYIRSKDVGYRKEQIVVLALKDKDVLKNVELIKTELLRNPNIVSVSSSNNLPNKINLRTTANWPGKPDNVEMKINVGIVDYNFIDLYEIEIINGRNFSMNFPSDAQNSFLLNESAVAAMGLESPLGKQFTLAGQTGTIIGIMKDFHTESLHQKIEPLVFTFKSDVRKTNYLSVKIKADNIPQTIDFLKERMKTFSPKYPFEYNFFDELFNSVYKSEEKTGDMLSLVALLAIFIACLGLFGLASFTTEQRTKEIGVRKVLGASIAGILLLLSREFMKWIFWANVIAWPVAGFVMNMWLQGFAYRTHAGFSIFILSGISTMIFALVSVGYQSIKTAMTNPVETLKYE